MEEYCRMQIYVGNEHAYISGIALPEEEKDKLIEGRLIDKTIQINAIIKNKTKQFPDLMGDSNIKLIVSEKFKQLLGFFIKSNEIQFLPIQMINEKYWLLNVLNNIKCFNWEKSTYTTFNNTKVLDEITNLVFDRQSLSGINIFRMKEEPFNLFIKKPLHDAIIENKLTGVRFIYSMDLTNEYEP